MPKSQKKTQERVAREDVKELWHITPQSMSKDGIKKSFGSSLQYGLAKDRYTATLRDNFMALGMVRVQSTKSCDRNGTRVSSECAMLVRSRRFSNDPGMWTVRSASMNC